LNNLRNNGLTASQDKILKQKWRFGNKYLVVIDESIIQKIGINENLILVEQELTETNVILLKIIKEF